ncbi:MAG: HAMP domain-containing histidine kinase [Planctomycetes bacterium]|nr:HAMP domain-containing histidine kinase [Planctomycetota bacterium]
MPDQSMMVPATLVFIAGAAVTGLLAWWLQRTRLAEREERARAAERRAVEAQQLAQLGTMSSGLAHEIKNPLSTIVLNAQLLREDILDAPLEADQSAGMVRRVDALVRETDRLRDILTDFLQYAGRMKVDRERIELRDVAVDLVDFLHAQAAQSGIRLLLSPPPERSVAVEADRGLLKQAALNLMLNAMQAMGNAPRADGGQHELMLRIEDGGGRARLHVIDTGPGIPADRIDDIFLPYVTTKAGGTGLGLPVARRIAREHGGDIRVHSEPGRGSDFTIELPAAG